MRQEESTPQVHTSTPQTDRDGSDDAYAMIGYESAQPALAPLAQMGLPFDTGLASD